MEGKKKESGRIEGGGQKSRREGEGDEKARRRLRDEVRKVGEPDRQEQEKNSGED